ncbi:hypothetical protein OESDEN_25554 [Oesophagostomum dentatum]|uniref:Uncharacterized protein n=1 Tax=Oesophagostomum dentatum TaxID=61180 RepID=A0A0B1RQC4_OESDE|nr:hypothetical protein OESDEN_25554 [Oesophagostomum dentatum]
MCLQKAFQSETALKQSSHSIEFCRLWRGAHRRKGVSTGRIR